ncbi:N-acetylmuramoyl-L-alanine amidase family protein [Pareuzebyella sediminis]|uniref:N-acetylmuramoyl-L-alanine amidase family protein n=1 Tax=Pareuzebyella sediminis TaxID=2607998 RepID=UPI0011EE0172|nr:N-acetylmuramoyl-L-alanine amidase [Pareuzebyella sediminis]
MLITLKFLEWGPFRNVKHWLRPLQFFVILMLQGCLVFAQQKVIVIDPGHGGKDTGAIGINQLQEKKVVLDIAMEIVTLNKTLFENRFDIYLTRYKDTLISLRDRTELSKALNADVFISLHCNHANNLNARGIEVYAYNSEIQYSIESIWFAYALQAEFKEKLGFNNRGVKFANFQVLRETVDYCTTVLLELGFLSNREENDYLDRLSGLRAVALTIMECLSKI